MSIASAVVLAAGEGRRLRPLTDHRPKPMLPATTTPILEFVFDSLLAAGITDITVVVGHGRDRVRSHFGSAYRDVSLTYVVQDKQLGSGHALLTAESTIDEPTLVVNGDQIVDTQILRDVVDAHARNDAVGTLGLISSPDVRAYGGVLLGEDDSAGTPIAELVENPRDDRPYLLNAGVYALEPSAIEAFHRAQPRAGEHSIVDGLRLLLEEGERLCGVHSEGIWIDATYPWDLLTVAETLFDAAIVESQVADSAQVHESATLLEPVVVGEDCVIGPGAVVGPTVSLGENVTVGANAVLERSVIDTDTRIGANATLIDCVTGRGVHFGPASSVVGGPASVYAGDRIHRDIALGALVADRVRDAGGVTYTPGTIVGSGTSIAAGSTVRGTIDADTEVR